MLNATLNNFLCYLGILIFKKSSQELLSNPDFPKDERFLGIEFQESILESGIPDSDSKIFEFDSRFRF